MQKFNFLTLDFLEYGFLHCVLRQKFIGSPFVGIPDYCLQCNNEDTYEGFHTS